MERKILEVSGVFYDPKLIENDLLKVQKKEDVAQSFMNNEQDDLDRIKEMWAFNLPCVLLVNGGSEYWRKSLCEIYKLLYKDILLCVRKSLSASLCDVASLIDLKDDVSSTV